MMTPYKGRVLTALACFGLGVMVGILLSLYVGVIEYRAVTDNISLENAENLLRGLQP